MCTISSTFGIRGARGPPVCFPRGLLGPPEDRYHHRGGKCSDTQKISWGCLPICECGPDRFVAREVNMFCVRVEHLPLFLLPNRRIYPGSIIVAIDVYHSNVRPEARIPTPGPRLLQTRRHRRRSEIPKLRDATSTHFCQGKTVRGRCTYTPISMTSIAGVSVAS